MDSSIRDRRLSGEDYEKLRENYSKVVCSNQIYVKKGLIKCPECGEEILVTPTLSKMNLAIEYHIQIHRHRLETESNTLLKYTKPIRIRLNLANQILGRA